MRKKVSLRITILCGLAVISLFCGIARTPAISKTGTPDINFDAFVYILNMGIDGNVIQYKGLRNGFVVGNGQYILTAAHCVQDFENSNHKLHHPMVISPYYGDFFEATIVAIDDKNDIAILKPNWGIHPSLDLETSAAWKKSKTITIAGYPPEAACRGGNGAISTQVASENVALRNTNGKGRCAIQVGPVQYPGKGWSGSPLINPETGKIISILSNEKYVKKFFFMKQHLIFGGSVDAIGQLFADNDLPCETSQQPIPNLNRKQQFEQILIALDAMRSNNIPKTKTLFKELCRDLPESYLANIIAGWIFDPPVDNGYYQTAIDTAPESPLAHAAYGHHLLTYNNPKKAARQFQIATNLDCNHLFAWHGQLTSLVKTDPNVAEICGLELTKQWPENAELCFEYSRSLRAQNKRTEELPIIQKAIELCGKTPFLYQRHLADSFKENHKYPQAEKAYQTLLETHECEHCWRAYALLLEKMGPEKSKQAKEANGKANSFKKVPPDVSDKNTDHKASQNKGT